MAKRNRNPILVFLYWVVGILGALSIPALFFSGVLFRETFLKFLPLIVHQVVGGVMLVTLVWGILQEFF